jgi:hypothetical protein
LNENGKVGGVGGRVEVKKNFDKEIFGTKYH